MSATSPKMLSSVFIHALDLRLNIKVINQSIYIILDKNIGNIIIYTYMCLFVRNICMQYTYTR